MLLRVEGYFITKHGTYNISQDYKDDAYTYKVPLNSKGKCLCRDLSCNSDRTLPRN